MSREFEIGRHEEYRSSLIELCERGLLTCTRGEPGEPGAKYALGWLPLDQAESFSEQVREHHQQNMQKILGELSTKSVTRQTSKP